MTKSQFTCLTALVLCLLPARGAPARTQVATGVTVNYVFPRQQLSLNQPVMVTFAINNQSPWPVKLDLGQDRKGGFIFDLVQPDGKKIRLPQYSANGMSELGTLSVAPGQTFSERLILNEWYQFKRPGTYWLSAGLRHGVSFEGGPPEAIGPTSSTGRIDIGPRNVEQLERVCGELSERLDQSTSYIDSSAAALELSYVTDSAAVPYLRRAFEISKPLQPIIIDGLARIGDYPAANALISFLGVEDAETVALVRGALERIADGTPDPTLKQQIQNALIRAGGHAQFLSMGFTL